MPDAGVREDNRSPLPVFRLAVLGAAGYVSVVTEVLPAGLLPAISNDYGVTESQTGLLNAVYAGIIVITAIPLMSWTSHLPRRTVLVAALALFAASNAALALSPSFTFALASRLLSGAAHGVMWALLAPYAARLVPEGRAGAAMAVVFGVTNLAAVTGIPLGALLGNAVGWRTAIGLASVLSAVLAIVVLLAMPTGPDAEPVPRRSLLAAMRRPKVLAVATALPLLFLAYFATLTYIAPFFLDGGASEATVSIALTLLGIGGVAGNWIAGRWADERGHRLLAYGIVGLAASYGLLGLFGHLTIGVLLMMLLGAVFAVIVVFFQAEGLRAAGPLKDAANTFQVIAVQAGIALGAVYGGITLDNFGSASIPYAAMVPVCIALVVTVTRITHVKSPRPEPNALQSKA